MSANRLNFIECEKSPKLLSWRLRLEASRNVVVEIQMAAGSISSDQEIINQTFFEHYKEVYWGGVEDITPELTQYVAAAALKHIETADRVSLERPLSPREIWATVESMAKAWCQR